MTQREAGTETCRNTRANRETEDKEQGETYRDPEQEQTQRKSRRGNSRVPLPPLWPRCIPRFARPPPPESPPAPPGSSPRPPRPRRYGALTQPNCLVVLRRPPPPGARGTAGCPRAGVATPVPGPGTTSPLRPLSTTLTRSGRRRLLPSPPGPARLPGGHHQRGEFDAAERTAPIRCPPAFQACSLQKVWPQDKDTGSERNPWHFRHLKPSHTSVASAAVTAPGSSAASAQLPARLPSGARAPAPRLAGRSRPGSAPAAPAARPPTAAAGELSVHLEGFPEAPLRRQGVGLRVSRTCTPASRPSEAAPVFAAESVEVRGLLQPPPGGGPCLRGPLMPPVPPALLLLPSSAGKLSICPV